MLKVNEIYCMDCIDGLQMLKSNSIDCCVSSPPYYALRDYGVKPSHWNEVKYSSIPGLPEVIIPEWEGCLGLEPSVEMYIGHIVSIYRQVYRVLKCTGTTWINLGDSYIGTGGDRKKSASGGIFDIQQSHNPNEGRNRRNQNNKRTGLKQKDLIGIPWRVAFALQADGWYLRMDNIWNKTNCMPESASDRPTRCHEYFFLLTKRKKYFYDSEAIMESCINGDQSSPRGSIGVIGNMNSGRRKNENSKTFRGGGVYTQGRSFNNSACIERESHGNSINTLGLRNKRSVWTLSTDSFREAHFATFPPKLIEPCILAGCPEGGIVLDPFMGSGTTGKVALQNRRYFIGFELNPSNISISKSTRLNNVQLKIF